MGPRVAGLSAARIAPAPRWRERLERTWGVRIASPADGLERAVAGCIAAWERGLAAIDFPEVTDQDRVMFLEHVIDAQVRQALRAGRFDLALELRSRGARRVLELHTEHGRWRPVLLYGVPPGITSSPASRA